MIMLRPQSRDRYARVFFQAPPQWLLILLLMLIIAWTRSLPLELLALETTADNFALAQTNQEAAWIHRLHTDPFQAQAPASARPGKDETFIALREDIHRQLREQYSYRGHDGQDHVYLGDYDSYAWLRQARNILLSGQACDQVRDGQCRDDLALAPHGGEMLYGGNLHPYMIAGMHRLLSWMRPGFPLASSAFWLSLLIAVLGVIPAFLLGHRLAGSMGGVAAGILVSLNAAYLSRSIGADNDVWNITLLLYLMLFTLGAGSAASLLGRAAHALAAAAVTILWSHLWSGWQYGHLLAAGSLMAAVLLSWWRPTPGQCPGSTLSVFTLYLVLAGLGVMLTQSPHDYLPMLWDLFSESTAISEPMYWPQALTTVFELKVTDLSDIGSNLGSHAAPLIAYTGLMLCLLPNKNWGRVEMSILAAAVVLIGLLSYYPAIGRAITVALLILPPAAALAHTALVQNDILNRDLLIGLTLAVWCLSSLWLGLSIQRFLMLSALPLGIGMGVALGRAYTLLADAANELPGYLAGGSRVALVAVFLLNLANLSYPGYLEARNYLPNISDALVSSLEDIRKGSPPESIVTNFWDLGYWSKYYAQRRVHNDGASLLTHVPYWVSRFYAASSDADSIAVLRMLNCGSDAQPFPEGANGALARLQTAGIRPPQAFRMLEKLLQMDRPAAAQWLNAQGMSAEQRDAVLAASHCTPPESLVIVSTRHLFNMGLFVMGQCDPPRHPSQQALNKQQLLYKRWLPCDMLDGAVNCAVGMIDSRLQARIDSFHMDDEHPSEALLKYRDQQGEHTASPGVIALIDNSGFRYIHPAQATLPDTGVLVDRPAGRILYGRRDFLESTHARLLLVEDYASPYFEPVTQYREAYGDRVRVWRVRQWQ